MASGIPSIDKINAVCAKALGNRFHSIVRTTGSDLANPPLYTYWPGVNPIAYDWDLGGGSWLSVRSQLYVLVQPLPDATSPEALEQYGELMVTLDTYLPAWVKANWAIQGEVFNFDSDPMDVTPFGA
jgi:hypothetical protein